MENKNEIWKTPDEISEITGTTIQDVIVNISDNADFVKNSENKFTTRKLYEKNTPFTDRVINAMINKIR